VNVETELRTGVPDDRAWRALADGTWAGPVRIRSGGAEYAGMLRLVDVDEDERRASVHAQARRVGGWGGVTLTVDVRIVAGRRLGAFGIAGETGVTGSAAPAVAAELERELGRRLATAVLGRDPSPADDPAWRRRLAVRAALAVAAGAAAGLAGAAWDRRRRA
jgi:hypothetical protein